MAELTGQQLLEAGSEVQTHLVDVSEWIPGGEMFVRKMSLEQHDAYEKSMLKIIVNGNNVKQEPDLSNRTAKLLVWTVSDKEGRLHYTPKDIEKLGKHPNKDMWRHIHDEAAKFNGLNKSIEDIAKNSVTTQPSTSDSE